MWRRHDSPSLRALPLCNSFFRASLALHSSRPLRGLTAPFATPAAQVTPQFLRGYVLRKRVASLGSGAALSCWGWYLTANNGPELHFGGHDFFPVAESPTQSVSNQARPAQGASKPTRCAPSRRA